MINRPATPSTSLSAVVTATTSSRPVFLVSAFVSLAMGWLSLQMDLGVRGMLINVDSTIHDATFVSSREACTWLGVRRETLYAYASRG
ncbi:MAG TPA: hypothetical protein VNO21_05580, partial [Polyangiaceae bacterium]|nr:hypothetical protein [Polyangiaceae bacterium]